MTHYGSECVSLCVMCIMIIRNIRVILKSIRMCHIQEIMCIVVTSFQFFFGHERPYKKYFKEICFLSFN